jgi:negative regulator of sigma E activity
MNRNDWESHLYAAKPTNDEIAPLSPEASARILAVALRENRRNSKRSFWLAAPLRVAVSSMAVAAVVYCMVPYINPADVPMTQQAPLNAPQMSPVAVPDDPALTSRAKTAKTLPKPSTLPVLPSTAPKPVKPQVMVAWGSGSGGAESRRSVSRPSNGVQVASHSRLTGRGVSGESPNPPTAGKNNLVNGSPEDGDMFVSVSGDNVLPPEGESDDALTITVKHDVPDTVTGSAEAAALQSVPIPSATPNPADTQVVPVWTHVRVETGEEPVLTLTALN